MEKSDVPSAAELFSGMPPLESVKALLSPLERKASEPLRCKTSAVRTSMEHGCEEELPEEKGRLPRENGHDLEYIGLLRKCMSGTVDACARWQAHHAQIMKEHGFVQGLSNHFQFVHVERDIGLLVHDDDFMVVMSTLEMVPKCLVLEMRWKVYGVVSFRWQHCDGSFVLEPCEPVGSHIWQG